MKCRILAWRDQSGRLHQVKLGGDEEALAQAISAETAAREQAIADEVAARNSAIDAHYTALGNAIDLERKQREQAIAKLGVSEGEAPLLFGAANGTAGKFDRQSAAPTATTALRYNGYFRATRVYGLYYSDNADYAEAYHVEGAILPGDLVAIGEGGRLTRNAIRGNPAVVGIVSTAPASVIGVDKDHSIPVAMMGRVPVRCVGTVRAGDFLMGSAVPGAVERATAITQRGAIVAQALEDKDDEGVGKLLALVVRL